VTVSGRKDTGLFGGRLLWLTVVEPTRAPVPFAPEYARISMTSSSLGSKSPKSKPNALSCVSKLAM